MRPNRLPPSFGLGFKREHFADIAASAPDLGFFEVHAENYMGDGGEPHAQLEALRRDYALRSTASASPSAAPVRSTRTTSRDSRPSATATSPKASRSIWPGRATAASTSTTFCRCPTPTRPLPRSSRISTRSSTPSAAGCCSRTPRPTSPSRAPPGRRPISCARSHAAPAAACFSTSTTSSSPAPTSAPARSTIFANSRSTRWASCISAATMPRSCRPARS